MSITPWVPVGISICALVISIYSLVRNHILEKYKNKASIQLWQRYSYFHGSDDNRTIIHIVIRNMSHRPTAIVDMYARNKDGGIIKRLNDKNNATVPLKLSPWDVQIMSFRVEQSEHALINDIILRDIDSNDNIIILKKAVN